MMMTTNPPLHTHKVLRRATINHLYILLYSVALLALFYHHVVTLYNPPTPSSFVFSLLILIADTFLAFSWACTQTFLVRPIRRQEFVENLDKVIEKSDLPAVDIFICTADPNKEPPMGTVNTSLSVLAYDYPPEKVSVYVSDDGGSKATLFAFIEAAKFAAHWLPFCRENQLLERCPEAYFSGTSYTYSTEAENLKMMYESMKIRVENVVDTGVIMEEHIHDDDMRQALAKWSHDFSRQDHPAIIQVLLDSARDKDISGQMLPKLIYVSRQKSRIHHHHFKAGALNALVRVSATMTNAPVVLTLDCDSYSNDPQAVKRAMCYLCDPEITPTLAYVQFPQIFRGLNRGDIYYGEHKRLYQINPIAMDGLQGPNYVGTGCFFQRRAFFGSPSLFVQPEIPELNPSHVIKKPVSSSEVLGLAHHVVASNYDDQTEWGSKMGFRYGTLIEDFYTGLRLHSMGWKSIFCHPERPAFLGDSPITLLDFIGQNKRWIEGHAGVLLSKHSSITFGVKHMGLMMGLAYSNNACWAILPIPMILYAFIPPIAVLSGISTLPKVSDPWCYMYFFLYVGANAKDLLDYLLEKGTVERWWNAQRMWMCRGLSSYLFGLIEYIISCFGIPSRGFSVTSKVQEDELGKRYNQGIFEFGVASHMFIPLTMAAIINLVSFVVGLIRLLTKGISLSEGLDLQILLSGVVVINCWPIYQAIAFRTDKGSMPHRVTIISGLLVSILCMLASSPVLHRMSPVKFL